MTTASVQVSGERRAASVRVHIIRGSADVTYRLCPVRPEGLLAGEARAWILEGSVRPYRLSISRECRTTCDCDGYRQHKNCKHVDWLGAWGIGTTPAEGLHYAQLECRVVALQGGLDQMAAERRTLHTDIDILHARLGTLEVEIETLMKERDDAREQLERQRRSKDSIPEFRTNDRVLYHAARLGYSIEAVVLSVDDVTRRARILTEDRSRRTVSLSRLSAVPAEVMAGEPPF